MYYPDGSRRPCSLRLPGCTGLAETADHVVPRVDGERVPESQGGRLLIPACRHCNSSRGDRELLDLPGEREIVEPWTPDP